MPAMSARSLSLGETEALRDDFVMAARRAEQAGFDGVDVHAALGLVLTQFLSPMFNKCTDRYGGSLENRSRLLFEVIDGSALLVGLISRSVCVIHGATQLACF